ncbi:MAG: T9SS type A sorting domain-containing protein [Cryomorphaceae bacterium]|nr:T9SS type A sorting domain-containing protein [Cryomorphaceae bacterium]
MRKFLFLITLIFSHFITYAQTSEISYEYDGNGNRIERFVVWLRVANDNSSETTQDPDGFDKEDGVLAMLDNARFTVYPNPTTSVIRAEWQIEDGDFIPIKEVRLVGLDGKPVQIISAPALPLDIDMRTLSPGTYVLWIMPEEGEIRRVKVVKQ